MTGRHLFCFGLGYSGLALARRLAAKGWRVGGTSRSAETAAALRRAGFAVVPFDREHPLAADALRGVTDILVSVPPEIGGDPVLDCHREQIAAQPGLRWLGYLSTTGVYGDCDGDWVDESAELRPTGGRGRRRVLAEAGWFELYRRHRLPVHVFRLAAIYGRGRSPFDALRAGTARRIDKQGQVFSRIHVADLARVIEASLAQPRPGSVYNVCDDEPAPPEAVTAHAAALLGLPAPPLVPIEAAGLSPKAASFWRDNKRVRNGKIKEELGVVLAHPDYRSGLAAILAAEARGLPCAPASGMVGPGSAGRNRP